MGTQAITLGLDGLTCAELQTVAGGSRLELSDKVRAEVAAAAGAFERRLARGERIYGVTTGVGAQTATAIPPGLRARYQLETVLAHACGTGPHLAWGPARAVWVVKAASMARARSGCSLAVVDALVELANTDLAPVIPVSGSLGASGDLVPSAHAALALLGVGEVLDCSGRPVPAAEARRSAGIRQLTIGPRDGLSLVNGTAATTALAAAAVDGAERALAVADQLVAAGVQAIGGHAEAFDPRVLSARPHPGALRSAERIRCGLGTGGRRHSVGAVPHDPYSWRCAPQVHGAVLDAVDVLRAAVDRELVSSSDNPVLAEERDTPLLSGGNFHGAPLGLPADSVTTAVAVAAALSRQRTAQLVSGAHAPMRPPPWPALGPLLVTATAEALRLGGMTPASLRWLPVDPMEDHVPNSLASARQAVEATEGLFAVLAVEAICVDAAAELNSVPGNPALDATRALMAEAVGPTSEARPMAADIARLAARLDIATVPQRGTP